MVAKINVGSSLYGVLAYNQNKVDEEHGKVLFSNRMFESEDGNFNIHRCLECFEMHLPQDIKTEKPIIHISLNPHPDDMLSDEQLAEIAQEYMEKLGYGNQPYMVFKHEDIDRHHMHIVSLRVDENGKKLNDKFEYLRSKDITRELEQKYGLNSAEKKQQQDAFRFRKVDYTAGDVKRQIGNTVKELVKTYQFQSINEFRALLHLYNITVEEIKGEVKGKPYHGLVYSALNDKGEKVGNPFKASLFGKTIGYEALGRKYNKGKENWKTNRHKDKLKNTISIALQKSKTVEQFQKLLEKQKLEVVFRKNETGRIYGATFFDHENKTVFNGSRLGKEFSANVFENHFNESQSGKQSEPKQYRGKGEPFVSAPPTDHLADYSNSAGGLFDLLPENNFIPEEKFKPQRKKKKRKRIT